MDLKARAEQLLNAPIVNFRVLDDTSNFLHLGRGDVLALGGKHYLLKGMEREGRFGLDDQPKQWVRTAVDMESGQPHIIKLVFHESFDMPIGPVTFRCVRSPAKEAAILELVEGHPGFMQGIALNDAAGNNVRIIERVKGGRYDQFLDAMACDHREYHQRYMRRELNRLCEAFRSIAWLHAHRQKHGDIRRDHLYIEKEGGRPVWIDFDYNFDSAESPFGLDIFGLGNVLAFVVGKGQPSLHWLAANRPDLAGEISQDDCSLIFKGRIFNLRKIYPYLPEELNRVLLHFTFSTSVFYESVEELLAELVPAVQKLPQGEDGP